MKVYTLVGKSGTGKSYQALALCKDLGIQGIIDDGLFIYENRVIGGLSAKRQSTTVGAIKTALFHQNSHRDSVVSALARVNPKSILIIGTSDRMVNKIISRLTLPEPFKRLYIEDITTEEEREAADKQRHAMGKHAIPVPTLQLKRDFAGYFVDPLRVFRDIGIGGKPLVSSKKNRPRDLSVVRPTFSYLGEFYISERIVEDIVRCVASEITDIRKVTKVYENMQIDSMIIDVSIIIDRNALIWETAMSFQRGINAMVENMTAFNISEVNVEVAGVI